MIDTSKQAGSLLPDSLTQLTKIAGLLLAKTSPTDSPQPGSATTSMSLNISPLDAVLHMIGGTFVKGNCTDIKEIVQHLGKYST